MFMSLKNELKNYLNLHVGSGLLKTYTIGSQNALKLIKFASIRFFFLATKNDKMMEKIKKIKNLKL
jgi:hypothetical protein